MNLNPIATSTPTLGDSAPACGVDDAWSSEGLPAHRQFEAWREVIVDAHLSWDIPNIACDRFAANMRQHRVGCARLTDCTAPARVTGVRRRAQIRRDAAAYLTVVHIAQGAETLVFDGEHELQLGQGQFTLWDSAQPMAFATAPGLRQLSLLVPEDQLTRRMPRARDLVGRPMDGRSGLGGLFIDHLQAVMLRLPQVPAEQRDVVLSGTLDLLALCLGQQAALPPPRLRQFVLEQVLRHIDQHLHEPGLDVRQLARCFAMTERNLHKLFEATGATVSKHIRDRRLALCRRDLCSSTLARRQVAEIARHWGFGDPSHFGKLFRAAYGMSPGECRDRAGASAAPAGSV
jgi:AraC-like DNA-binding protein